MSIFWWCSECLELVVPAAPIEGSCVERHKGKVVGIRDDIMRDGIKRLVGDLRLTDRLVKYQKAGK